jgi:hypothetical protein
MEVVICSGGGQPWHFGWKEKKDDEKGGVVCSTEKKGTRCFN